ncbi:MAG: rRNA adenine N-6-methyltransferase family protein [Candidatus Levybacteria bacterium]|nr:rRNA adenine N-6-methyltransferase family protein [Candidatus Levybacteria bacterium]
MENDKLLKKARNYLKYNQIKIPQKEDIAFLVDSDIIEKLIRIAKIGPRDRVLEIGPGLGFITKAIAKKAKHVLGVEINRTFKIYLSNLDNNVDIFFKDIKKLLQDEVFLARTKVPTKVVSNIPYSQAQDILLTFAESKWYKGDLVWIAPTSFADKINAEPILSKYFQATVIEKIPNTAFYPVPNTDSAIIHFRRLPSS